MVSVIGQIYIALFALSGLACVAAIPRARSVDDADVRRGLFWLLATAGGWALLKTAFFIVPGPFRKPVYVVGLAIGFGTVWAWLYFCSAYAGQTYHRNTSLRRLGAGIFLVFVSLKLTNPLHGAYFSTTEMTTPFTYLAIHHEPLHWVATGISYVFSAVGMFIVFQLYLESGYDTRPLAGLTVLIGLPVVFDIVAQVTPWLIDVIYAPIGVAMFAIGVLFVFERRFLAVQGTAPSDDDDLSIYLDERGVIQDYTPSVRGMLPELDDASGDRLVEAVPSVAEALDSNDQILERERSDEQRYYFVSASKVTLGDASVRLVQLSDVTETERQQREINEQNELYQAILDASFAFVFRIDLEGRFTFISPAVEEFLGYSPAELEGQPISATLPDEVPTERAWTEIEPIVNGEPNNVRDFQLETKAGTTVYTDIRGVPIYDANVPVEERTSDDIVGIQLMVRDATERRQREGLISVINRVLRHNLRNQMTIITGYAEMLASDLEGDAAAKAMRIKNTAEQLLDLSESAQQIEENRELSLTLNSMDLGPILDRNVSKLRDQYPEASITVDAPETVVVESHERIETALWEVIDNAARHSGASPSVAIDVTVGEVQVAVTVSDDGPGLPQMEREVLESGKETPLVHGEGLGLWVAYWIVTSLDGELDAEASSDGTRVTVRLPAPE